MEFPVKSTIFCPNDDYNLYFKLLTSGDLNVVAVRNFNMRDMNNTVFLCFQTAFHCYKNRILYLRFQHVEYG